MTQEKMMYHLLTNNKHRAAVKNPEDEKKWIGRADLEFYYWLKLKENEYEESPRDDLRLTKEIKE